MSSSTGGDGGSKEGGAPPADLFDGLFGDLPAEAAATATKKPPSTSAAAAMKKEEEGKAAAVAAEEDGTKKRKAGAAAGGEEWEEEGGGSGGTKRSKEEGEGKGQKGGTVELEVALQKISVALRSSKVEKFRKAGELLLKLMVDMDMTNRMHFHSALAFFMAEEGSWERLVATGEDRALSERVFGAVQARILLFTPEEQYRAATWVLLGGIRPKLFTDDSYEFRRAMKQLKEYVTCLQPCDPAQGLGDSFADRERRRAVLACLGTALKRGLLFAWAKPSVEEAFALATEKRLVAFPEEEREGLDEMATQLRTARHGQSVNPGGGPAGSVVSRSVRLANSMSTPWNRKAGDIYR